MAAGWAQTLIRENNNLSEIYMMCVCFPNSLYIGIIHHPAWHLGTEEGRELPRTGGDGAGRRTRE